MITSSTWIGLDNREIQFSIHRYWHLLQLVIYIWVSVPIFLPYSSCWSLARNRASLKVFELRVWALLSLNGWCAEDLYYRYSHLSLPDGYPLIYWFNVVDSHKSDHKSFRMLQQDFSFGTMRPSIWPIMWIFSIFESYWHLESIYHNMEIGQRSFNVIFTNLHRFGHFGAMHNIPYMVGRLALFHSSWVSISFFLCRVFPCKILNTHDEASTFSQCSTLA